MHPVATASKHLQRFLQRAERHAVVISSYNEVEAHPVVISSYNWAQLAGRLVTDPDLKCSPSHELERTGTAQLTLPIRVGPMLGGLDLFRVRDVGATP